MSMSMASVNAAQDVTLQTGAYSPNWESLSTWQCPQWFEDAKFGIWAHWGPQCEAEDGDWYARNMYIAGSSQNQYHIDHFGDPSEFGLKDLCNAWKAENWDPDKLIALYKSVGARYFFTLGQHHDNFDLWNSPYQEWNSVNVGPKKDIVKGWSDACKKYGLPLGISMHGSHTWTWLEPSQDYDGKLTKADGKGKWWEGMDPQELYAQNHTRSADGDTHWEWQGVGEEPSEAYKTKFQNRVLECINDYQPDMLYFDDTVLPFYGCDDQVGLNILSHYYNTRMQKTGSADVVVMGKKLNTAQKKALLWDVERGVPDAMQEKHWQTCTCIGEWHYNKNVYNNNSYKSAQQVIDMLIDIVSKNGNLLLSVPVKADGTIDDKEEAILADIKAWMDVNSRSIYATRTWKTFGEGPLADAANPLSGQGFNESNNYSAKDVRYVTKNDTLFATIMRWPSVKTFTFKNLGQMSQYFPGKIKSIQLLGYGDVDYKLNFEGLTVTLPSTKTNAIAPVFAITFQPGTDQAVSLSEALAYYDAQIDSLRSHTSYNTGKMSRAALNTFAAKVDSARQQLTADDATQLKTVQSLYTAWTTLQTEGLNAAGLATTDGSQDVTTTYLVEKNNFTRTPATQGSTRFGAPQNWTVENFMIPNGTDGTKNGLDHYSGSDCLMLGVWNDQAANQQGNLSNARIYRKVHLDAGRYFFGATYQTTYNLSDQAYLFAADSLTATDDIPQASIAYCKINQSPTNSTCYGITFTLPAEQDVILGFQADLTGTSTQEFRASDVSLLYYGKTDLSGLRDLYLTADGLCSSVVVNTNTGFYNKETVDALQKAMEEADKIDEYSSAEEVSEAYFKLNAAIKEFTENGKNPGGAPSDATNENLTVDLLHESSAFARTADTQGSQRYGTPQYWTVENYKIPAGTSGTRNGIDHYPGFDCLSLGIWDDKQNNGDGDISNARIYQKVHLKAGRWYFGATYNTTYNLNSQAYIFASSATLNTADIPTSSIAYYAINNAKDKDGLFWGISFSIEKEQDVILGFQANLDNGSNEQEFRAQEIKLLYYGEITYDKIQTKVSEIEAAIGNFKYNDNTGYYSTAALAKLKTAIANAKALSSSASYDELDAANNALLTAYNEFLTNGKNAGGNPDQNGTTDITANQLLEASEFTRTADTQGSQRYGTPKNWTVENYSIPAGTSGTRNGLDNYPGYDCLSLGIWDDRDNNTDGDLTNARIYRKVTLDAGRYYFGATYNTIYNLGSAYIFAADATLPTTDMEKTTIAYDKITNATSDGKFHGIYFTLPQKQDVVLGFQTDLLNGNAEQEFRAASVTLLSYNTADGIEDAHLNATDANSVPMYFTISGMRLSHAPHHGLYIEKQGTQVRKIFKK
jgi:alpha-L-fucosidase